MGASDHSATKATGAFMNADSDEGQSFDISLNRPGFRGGRLV